MTEAQKDIYGKVDNGIVIEFPVTVDIILNRGHSVHDYTPVTFVTAPYYDTTRQKLTRGVSVRNGRIYVEFTLTSLSLNEVLQSFKTDAGVKAISEIDTGLIEYVRSLLSNHVEVCLDRLCNLRDYSSLNNALARYRNSTIEAFKKESDYLQLCLDNAWKAMGAYQTSLLTGKIPLPTSIDEVDAVVKIPKNWDNFL